MKLAERLKEGLGSRILNLEIPTPKRIYATVGAGDIEEAARFVFRTLDARYVVASGVDNFKNFEILYHFSVDREDVFISLRVFLDKDKPEIASLTGLIPGVEWIEREMWELLGINFANHPNLTHFLLSDDWPEGNYPLRKVGDGT